MGGGPAARRRPLRLLFVAVAVLVLLVAGAVGTYAWSLQHWFVGVDGTGDAEHVAVFRGLNVSIVGFDLFEVDQPTDLAVMDLTPAARSRVRGGITADDSADADRILSALRDQRLPPCPPAGSKGGSEGTVTTTTPSRPTTGPTTTGPTTTRVPGTTTGPNPPPSSRTTSTTPTTSARTTTSSEPGVNCREAK
jgi:protein phosphatase